jgi:hypothetical protein
MLPRLNADEYQQPFVLSYDHVQVTDDTTIKLCKIPTGKRVRVDKVQYVNPTGLTQDGTNYFTVKLLNGSTVAYSWSTLTGAQGTLTADTFVNLVASNTDADLVFGADAEMKLMLDESGTATLPAGRINVFGRFV